MITRIVRQSMAALLAAGLISGCAQDVPDNRTVTGDRADNLLDRALSAVEKEQPSYKSTTELIVAGIPVPGPKSQAADGRDAPQALEWDPVESLMFLREAGTGKTVTLEKDPDVPNGQLLRVELDEALWTERVRKVWQTRIETLQSEGSALIRKQTSRVTGEKAVLLGQELKASLDKARSQMSRMAETLEADGTYRIKLQPGISSPQELIIENRLRYETDGKTREETVRSTYDFRRHSSP